MGPVPFNDLRRHWAPHADRLEAAVQRVVRSGWYLLGPETEAFESEFAASATWRAASAVANGTDALEIALRALGCGPGDEVIVAANAGMYATTAVPRHRRHAGVRRRRPGIAAPRPPTSARRARDAEHGAVVATHLYGNVVDVDALRRIAPTRSSPIVEDGAQAHGASIDGRPVGSLGDIAAFSFYPTKNLGALGDAGAVVSNRPELLERARRCASTDGSRATWPRSAGRPELADRRDAGGRAARVPARVSRAQRPARAVSVRSTCEALGDRLTFVDAGRPADRVRRRTSAWSGRRTAIDSGRTRRRRGRLRGPLPGPRPPAAGAPGPPLPARRPRRDRARLRARCSASRASPSCATTRSSESSTRVRDHVTAPTRAAAPTTLARDTAADDGSPSSSRSTATRRRSRPARRLAARRAPRGRRVPGGLRRRRQPGPVRGDPASRASRLGPAGHPGGPVPQLRIVRGDQGRARARRRRLLRGDGRRPPGAPGAALEFVERLGAGDVDLVLGRREGGPTRFVSRIERRRSSGASTVASCSRHAARRGRRVRLQRGGALADPRAGGGELVARRACCSGSASGAPRSATSACREPRARAAWTLAKKVRYLSDSIFSFTDLPIRFLLLVGLSRVRDREPRSRVVVGARGGSNVIDGPRLHPAHARGPASSGSSSPSASASSGPTSGGPTRTPSTDR